ncbi:MAG: hypothetical protein KTR30_11235 [Saprospiraceae bacterium]|nr:hypothetical protein [Saprospiraceae bacterium]
MKKILLYIGLLFCCCSVLSAQDGWNFDEFKKNARTWRDSGYYLQIELIDLKIQKLGVTSGGEGRMIVNFQSADQAGQQYRGEAVFTFSPNQVPSNINLQTGVRGKAAITIAQDVLICPSPEAEVGLGQNDPFFPLYYPGFLLKVDGESISNPTPISIELRNIEIIL